MIAKLHSAALRGVEAVEVEVEVNSPGTGTPRMVIVGLPDAAVRESAERVTSAALQDGDTVHLGPVALKFDNGQLQIHVELEPDNPTPDTKTNRKLALAAVLVLVIGLAVAVPLLVQQSDDADLPAALPEASTTTLPTTPESTPPTSTVPVTTAVATTRPKRNMRRREC